MLDFPVSPTVGQQFSAAGVTWIWDGAKWTAGGLSVAYLPLAGGTMVGDLILNRDPVVALGAATKEYADLSRYGDNRIINGDMRIDQRNNGASGTVSAAYTVDRWQYNATQTSKMAWGRGNTAGLPAFPYNLGFTSSSAYTPLTGDTFYVSQAIEADAISDFAFGTVNAQPITLSFWATSSLTGTFSGALTNYASPYRSYPFAFSIPTANVWTKVIIAIPGDISGTWALSGSSGALYVRFDLGSGATFRAPTGAWVSGNFVGANGSVNTVATNGAIFLVTGVKLEIGSVATPYNRQSLAKSMADCQRYYQKLGGGGTTADVIIEGYAAGAGANFAVSSTIGIPAMRANPTATLVGTWASAINISATNLFGGLSTLGIQIFPAAAGSVHLYTAGNASTYISLSAEL